MFCEADIYMFILNSLIFKLFNVIFISKCVSKTKKYNFLNKEKCNI
jgi:hypothetical protein